MIMITGTKIGGGKISFKHRLIFVFGVIIGAIITPAFYLPQPVKKLIKAVLKRV